MKDNGKNVSTLLDCFMAVSFGIGTYHNVQFISLGGGGEKMLLPEPGHTTIWQTFHIPENVLYILF